MPVGAPPLLTIWNMVQANTAVTESPGNGDFQEKSRQLDTLRTSLSESRQPAPGASRVLLGGACDSGI